MYIIYMLAYTSNTVFIYGLLLYPNVITHQYVYDSPYVKSLYMRGGEQFVLQF
jgi:hypothetical protein